MIIRGTLSVSARYYGAKAVSAVYYGTKLVWEAISSCFGSGYWIGEKPWKSEDVWVSK